MANGAGTSAVREGCVPKTDSAISVVKSCPCRKLIRLAWRRELVDPAPDVGSHQVDMRSRRRSNPWQNAYVERLIGSLRRPVRLTPPLRADLIFGRDSGKSGECRSIFHKTCRLR